MVQVQSTNELDIIHNQPLAVIIVASLVVYHLNFNLKKKTMISIDQ
jgi:hypothetical protein